MNDHVRVVCCLQGKAPIADATAIALLLVNFHDVFQVLFSSPKRQLKNKMIVNAPHWREGEAPLETAATRECNSGQTANVANTVDTAQSCSSVMTDSVTEDSVSPPEKTLTGWASGLHGLRERHLKAAQSVGRIPRNFRKLYTHINLTMDSRRHRPS